MPCCDSLVCCIRSNPASDSEVPANQDDKNQGCFKNPKLKKVISKGKALLFILLNAILPSIDILSDVFTFVELLDSNNPRWAASTLTCIFLPFIAKACMLLWDLVQGKASLKNLAGLFLNFPLVSPLVFATLGVHLLIIDESKATNCSTVETINKVAGLSSLYESFFESGPQLLVQLNVVSCTGRISKFQMFSMSSSIVLLSLTSARAFFIQRDVVHADPAPNVHMLLKTFPWTFALVTSSAIQWTYVGNLKELILLSMASSGAITWLALWASQCITNIRSSNALVVEKMKHNGTDIELSPHKSSIETDSKDDEEVAVEKVEENHLTSVVSKQPSNRNVDQVKANLDQIEVSHSNASEENNSRLEMAGNVLPVDTEHIFNESVARQKTNTEERIMIKETCLGFLRCSCTLGMCLLIPCAATCCKCVESNGRAVTDLRLLGQEVLSRFRTPFFAYSNGMTSLLKEPVNSEDNRFFRIKSSLTSIFVPCVVGKRSEPNTFLVAALTSLLVRLLAIYITATINLPSFIRSRTTLLVCTSEEGLTDLNQNSICSGLECLAFCSSDANVDNEMECFASRFRRCNDDEDYIWRTILHLTLVLTTLLSVVSSFRLAYLSNYVNLYNASRGCCCCFLAPIVHRSVLFSFIQDGKIENLRTVLKHADLTRHNHDGFSPVHMAVLHADNEGFRECLSLLVSDESSTEADSRGFPLHTAVGKENVNAIKELLAHGAKVFHSPEGHLPINCYGDSHAAFKDGRSRLVGLAKANRDDIAKMLFARQMEGFPQKKRSNIGVRHLIYSHSDLSCTLKVTENQEMLALLDPSLPLANFTKEEGEALTRKLADLGIKAEDDGIWFTGEKKRRLWAWSDQEHYQNQKRLTSIQVEIDGDNFIRRLRVAFDREWCDWRETSSFGDPFESQRMHTHNKGEQPPLVIGPEETIVGVTTTHAAHSGWLTSLELRLSSGRRQIWGDTRTEGTKRIKTVTERPLAYLSGGKAFDGGSRVYGQFQYQLTFHWEDLVPCT